MDTEAMYYGGDGTYQHKRLLSAEKSLAKFYKVGYRSKYKKVLGHYITNSPLSTEGDETKY
jgi:hypothetical protein